MPSLQVLTAVIQENTCKALYEGTDTQGYQSNQIVRHTLNLVFVNYKRKRMTVTRRPSQLEAGQIR